MKKAKPLLVIPIANENYGFCDTGDGSDFDLMLTQPGRLRVCDGCLRWTPKTGQI